MRFILDKYPGAKISGLKYSIAIPFNALDNLPSDNALNNISNKQVKPISKCSLALIIDLI
jgi:hypothetical protein